VVSRGGNQGIDVVDERNVGLDPPDYIINFAARLPRINALGEEQSLLNDIEVLGLVVVARIGDDLVSVTLEQLCLSSNNRVLAPELLVRTVYEKNFHAGYSLCRDSTYF
jgi:hypothetical protein